jgi:hypothetical protein
MMSILPSDLPVPAERRRRPPSEPKVFSGCAEFANYLKSEKKTLAKFAQEIGSVRESTVARWRDGTMFPRPHHMTRIEAVTSGAVTYKDFQRLYAKART